MIVGHGRISLHSIALVLDGAWFSQGDSDGVVFGIMIIDEMKWYFEMWKFTYFCLLSRYSLKCHSSLFTIFPHS